MCSVVCRVRTKANERTNERTRRDRQAAKSDAADEVANQLASCCGLSEFNETPDRPIALKASTTSGCAFIVGTWTP